ncbi:MAG: hypothetical protein AAGJ50_12095, partial [Pseudomonadota bacterium]
PPPPRQGYPFLRYDELHESGPGTDPVIRHNAEMGILALAVVGCMVGMGLNDPRFLKVGDQAAVFLWALMGSGMDFIFKHAEYYHRQSECIQKSTRPETEKDQQADDENLPVAGEKGARQKATRCVMMLLILPDCMAEDGPVGIAVPVFKPMEYT